MNAITFSNIQISTLSETKTKIKFQHEEDLQVSKPLLFSHLPPTPLHTPFNFENRRRQTRCWLPTSAVTKQLQDMHGGADEIRLS